MTTKEIDEGNIRIVKEREHEKASERYFDVVFHYPDKDYTWEGSVPYQYRRTGLFAKTKEDKLEVVQSAYDAMHPSKREDWLTEQEKFWDQKNKKVTREFFELLKDCQWKCRTCQLPSNPNFARRIQDIKELGYTIATDISRYCATCKKNMHQLIMLRLPRGGQTGYENWSPSLRKRILKLLEYWDAYERRKGEDALLPDHKFPEIRWGRKAPVSLPDDMTDAEIKPIIQLLDNRRNQQKREVCRNCFQTGKRGMPYSIKFFHEGGENWPEDVPKFGPEAERGCIGCGWYDLDIWHEKLNEVLRQARSSKNSTKKSACD